MENVVIASQGATLEGILWPPPSEEASGTEPSMPRWAAIVCHPHPQYGGTMHNKVVFRAGRALQSLGMAVLRFNFRGVGKSTGSYDFGQGEKEDVRAAIAFMQRRFPGARIVLTGYSFGAWVGLQVGCTDDRVSHLIGIGTPVATNDFSFLTECRKPKLFVQGTQDEFGPIDQMEALLLAIPQPKELVLIEGADHFFTSKLEALHHAILDHFRELM